MRSLGGYGFLAMYCFFFFYINLANVCIESSAKHRFSIWQRAEKSWKKRLLRFFLKKKKIRLSYFSPSILPFLIRSFFPTHRFERHSAVTWLFPLAREKGSLHSLSSSTILYNFFCYFVFRLSLFFISQNALPPLYMHLIECEM